MENFCNRQSEFPEKIRDTLQSSKKIRDIPRQNFEKNRGQCLGKKKQCPIYKILSVIPFSPDLGNSGPGGCKAASAERSEGALASRVKCLTGPVVCRKRGQINKIGYKPHIVQ